MLSNDTLTTAIAALYTLRASNETWIGGNQVERVDAAIAELEATAPKGHPTQAQLAAPDAMPQAYSHRNGEPLTPDSATGTYWIWSEGEGFWTDYWGDEDGWSGFDDLYYRCRYWGPIPLPDPYTSAPTTLQPRPATGVREVSE